VKTARANSNGVNPVTSSTAPSAHSPTTGLKALAIEEGADVVRPSDF